MDKLSEGSLQVKSEKRRNKIETEASKLKTS